MSDFMQWVTHGIKRGQFEMDRRIVLGMAALVVALALVAASYLMLVSRIAARGRHIEQLQTQLFELQRENEQLEVELARESAISRLEERAARLGFQPAEEVEFLSPAADGP